MAASQKPAPGGRPGVLLMDLDGTLADSAPDLAAAVNRLLAEHDRPALDVATVETMLGDGARVLVQRAFAAASTGLTPDLDPLTARFVAIYGQGLTDETRLYPGVPETLSALAGHGWRLAVCTNKPEAAARQVIEDLGIGGLIEQVAGGDTHPVRKPDPEHLRVTLRAMDAGTDGAVMLGDGRNDVLAAQAAGLPVIYAAYGYGDLDGSGLVPDATIDDFTLLPDTLSRLFAVV